MSEESTSSSKLIFEADSSSVIVKAVSSALRGEIFRPVSASPLLILALRLATVFGRSALTRLVSSASHNISIKPSQAAQINSSLAAKWVTSQYLNHKKYRVVFAGAPSGGTAHLSSLLGAPLLTQHFLTCVKHPKTAPDDVEKIVKHGINVAKSIASRNEDLEVIVHYDPVHDRLLAGHVNTIRVKLKTLPPEYRTFIERGLEPGGSIVFLNVKYRWLQYVVKENIHVQVGGLGGISDKEYLHGNERLDAWLASMGSPHRGGWMLRDYSLEYMPESEWGTFPGLREELKEFADNKGYEFIEITVDHPEHVSEIAAGFYVTLLEKPSRWFFDCFTSINPAFNIKTSTVPLWLPFNCSDSYAYAERFLKKNKAVFNLDSTIYFTLTPNFVATPDQVEPSKWFKLFSEYGRAKPVAVCEKLYPADITHIFNFYNELRKMTKRMYKPIKFASIELFKDYLGKAFLN